MIRWRSTHNSERRIIPANELAARSGNEGSQDDGVSQKGVRDNHRREFETTAELVDPEKNASQGRQGQREEKKDFSPNNESKWSDKRPQHHASREKRPPIQGDSTLASA